VRGLDYGAVVFADVEGVCAGCEEGVVVATNWDVDYSRIGGYCAGSEPAQAIVICYFRRVVGGRRRC